MGKFFNDFVESQIAEWEKNYLNYKALKSIIASIYKDISKTDNNDNKYEIEAISKKKIEDDFPELLSLENSQFVKYFISELEKETHNVYLFYLEIEKQIYVKINSRLYLRNEYKTYSVQEILTEIDSLTNIIFFCLNCFYYTDQNIEAIKKILYHFDKKFKTKIKMDISELFFKRKITTENSDIKYMLRFKILIETGALIEKLSKELDKVTTSNRNIFKNEKTEIDNKLSELKQYIFLLNEKNTNRVNNRIYDLYTTCPISDEKNAVIKNIDPKELTNIDNSFLFAANNKDEHTFKNYEAEEYDKINKIKMATKNKVNVTLCLIHTFIYNFFYISPYIPIITFIRDISNENANVGIILSLTHVGVLCSQILFYFLGSHFKISFIVSLLMFMSSLCLSFLYTQQSRVVQFSVEKFTIFLSLGRFIYGLGSAKVVSRKYFIEFLPESRLKTFSMIYIVISSIGLICGMFFNIIFEFVTFSKTDYSPFDRWPIVVTKYNCAYFIGFFVCLVMIIVYAIGFTQPLSDIDNNKIEPMLKQTNEIVNEVKNDNVAENNSINVNLSSQMRIFTKIEKNNYSSIEDELIHMNSNKMDDTNMIQKVINEIKNKNFFNSKTFWICFSLIFSSLLIMKMIIEFIIISAPFVIWHQLVHEFKFRNDSLIFGITTLFVMCTFPTVILIKIKKGFKNEKKYILYSLAISILIMSLIIINNQFNDIDYFSFSVFTFLAIILLLITSFSDALSNFLNVKLLPNHFNICYVNIKFIISLSGLIGKIIGSVLVAELFSSRDQEWYSYKLYIVFIGIEVVLIILYIRFDTKLRVKALNKLLDIDE